MANKRFWISGAGLLLLLAVALWTTLALAAPGSEPQSPPLSQGPANGTSGLGVLSNTLTVPPLAPAVSVSTERGTRKSPTGEIEPVDLPSPPAGSNEIDDDTASNSENSQSAAPLQLVKNFQGLTDISDAFGFSHIPPDPVTAAGPNHLMGLVNTSFGIFSKFSGALDKRIDATVWFADVLPNKIGHCEESPLHCVFDPKVIYDHFANRWVMVWLASDRTSESWILVSASDDDDPNGNWYRAGLSVGTVTAPPLQGTGPTTRAWGSIARRFTSFRTSSTSPREHSIMPRFASCPRPLSTTTPVQPSPGRTCGT